MVQHIEEILRVTVNRTHPVAGEKLREDALHRHATLQNVGDAGRTAGVVLEHEITTVAVADQVRAADMDIDFFRDIEAHELRTEVLGAADDFLRDDPLFDNALVVVDVVEEGVERVKALFESALDMPPFVAGNDPWHEIEGENALRAFLLLVVDGEGDALVEVSPLGDLAFAVEVVDRQTLRALQEHPVVRTHLAGRGEHLIEEIAGFVVGKKGRHNGPRKIPKEHEICHPGRRMERHRARKT